MVLALGEDLLEIADMFRRLILRHALAQVDYLPPRVAYF